MLGPEIIKQLVYFEPFKKVLFPLNALNPDKEDDGVAQAIRATVESSIAKRTRIPIWWYVLLVLMRGLAKKLKKRLLRKSMCASIAHALGFTDEAFEASLRFFDELNIIKYSSALPNVVFVDAQVPLDKTSELVQYSYALKLGHVSTPLEGDWKRFCEGVLTLEFLKSFPDHYEEGVFEASHFLELLKSRLATVPLAKLDSSAERLASAEEYFMPALLDILSRKELDEHRVFTSAAAPLLFRFSHGCRRAGVFYCLAIYLMMHCDWSIKHKDGELILVARNYITFRHPQHSCFITLIDAFYYIEAHVKATPFVCYKVCPLVREEILSGITHATEKLKYMDDVPQLAVFCPHPSPKEASSSPSTKVRHAAVMEEKDNCCICTKSANITDLEDKHTIWFLKPIQACESQVGAVKLTIALEKSPQQLLLATGSQVGVEQLPTAKKTSTASSLRLPTSKSMVFIEWKNEQGKTETFCLKEQICNKWHILGCLLDVPLSVLSSWEKKHLKDDLACINEVLCLWLEEPNASYPNTWEGLYRLLKHASLGQVAEDLKRALDNAV